MMNQLVVVGKIYSIDKGIVNVAVKRIYQNENGEYDTDIIPFNLIGNMYNNVEDFCKIDDTIGIKARIEIQENNIVLIAEKVTFLSSNVQNGKNE